MASGFSSEEKSSSIVNAATVFAPHTKHRVSTVVILRHAVSVFDQPLTHPPPN
jgi:hypothetical protein